MTIARYSDLLRKDENILLKDMGDLRSDPAIPNSVLMTWQISFDQINNENRPAADLLSLMSVFDRQGIPKYFLKVEDGDDSDFEDRLASLEEFSLITLAEGGGSFQIHRLVQIAVKSWLEQHGEVDAWKQNALKIIAESLPDGDYENWKTWEILLPHTVVALDYFLPDRESELLLAEILHYTGHYFKELGKYDLAKERCQRAFDIRMDLLGEEDIRTLGSLVILAGLKRQCSSGHLYELEEAETMLRKAVGICERWHGKESLFTLDIRNGLALVLLDTDNEGKVDEAFELLQSILDLRREIAGVEHPHTLNAMNNLAGAYRRQCKFDEAEKIYRERLNIWLRTQSEEDPSAIYSMCNLAVVLGYSNRHIDAEIFAKRALDLGTVLGEEHPHTLQVMRVLQSNLARQADHDGTRSQEAENCVQRVVLLHRTVLGEKHLSTMDCTHRLAVLMEIQEKYDEAEDLQRHVLDIRMIVLGAEHPTTIKETLELVEMLQYRDDHEKAEALFRKLLDIRPAVSDDAIWDRFFAGFAETLMALGKDDKAGDLMLDERATILI